MFGNVWKVEKKSGTSPHINKMKNPEATKG